MDAKEEILKKHLQVFYLKGGYPTKDIAIKHAMEEYASPLKERIKELENLLKGKVDECFQYYNHGCDLQSQLKEANNQLERERQQFKELTDKNDLYLQKRLKESEKFKEWISSNYYSLYQELIREFELIEQENK